MLGQLPQRIDRKQVRRFQGDIDTLVLFVRSLAADGMPPALSVFEETKGPATLAPAPLQPLVRHHRACVAFIYGQVISDQGRFGMLAVLDFYRNRPLAAARFDLFCSPSFVPGPAQPQFETFGQECENVEDR